MSEQARVDETEILERFRAALIVFIHAAHRSVDEVSDDVRRTRGWLMDEQRRHWEMEIRKRTKALDAAQTELLTARMSNLRDNTMAQEQAVRRAREALREAEEKVRNVKKWTRDYEHAIEPLYKRLEGLRYLLDHDLPKGLAFLAQAQKTLEDYAQMRAPTSEPTSSP